MSPPRFTPPEQFTRFNCNTTYVMKEPDNSRDRVFCTPDAQMAIFRHSGLSHADLAKAARVNRSWFKIVSPFLWEDLQISRIKPYRVEMEAGARKQAQHIRTLSTSSYYLVDWLAKSPQCVNLSVLDIWAQKTVLTDDRSLYKVLSRNKKLKTLRLHPHCGVNLFPELVDGLMAVEPGFLTTLDIGRLKLDERLAKVLNHHASTIETLIINKCKLASDTFKDIGQLPNLKTLRLGDENSGEGVVKGCEEGVLALLKAAPGLLKFTLASDNEFLGSVLSQALISGAMTVLKTLAVRCTNNNYYDDEPTAKLLQNLPTPLENIFLRRCRFGELSNAAWSKLVTSNHQLISIGVHTCVGMTGESVQATLTNCPNLIEIGWDETVLTSAKFVAEPWVCTKLQKAEVCIAVCRDSLVGSSKSPDVRATDAFVLTDCEKVFSQLGKLTQLTELKLELHGPRMKAYIRPLVITGKEDEARAAGKSTPLEKKFLSFWSKLSTCTYIKQANFELRLPRRMASVQKLQQASSKMWGDQAKVNIHLTE